MFAQGQRTRIMVPALHVAFNSLNLHMVFWAFGTKPRISFLTLFFNAQRLLAQSSKPYSAHFAHPYLNCFAYTILDSLQCLFNTKSLKPKFCHVLWRYWGGGLLSLVVLWVCSAKDQALASHMLHSLSPICLVTQSSWMSFVVIFCTWWVFYDFSYLNLGKLILCLVQAHPHCSGSSWCSSWFLGTMWDAGVST